MSWDNSTTTGNNFHKSLFDLIIVFFLDYSTSQSSHQTYNQQHYERYESTTTVRPYTYKPIYPNLNSVPAEVNNERYWGAKDSQYQYASNR